MTPRERVLAAAAHRRPDRVPVDYYARSDVSERLMAYLGAADREALYRRLGIDVRRISVAERHARFEAKTNGVLGGRSERSGRRYILHDRRVHEDAWGVVFRLSEDGLYNEWISGPFAGTTDLDSFDWPDMSGFESTESLKRRIAALGGEFAVMGTLNYPFKVAWHMRGFENYLCDSLADPGFARALLERAAAYELEKGRRLAAAGADIVAFYGDIAMQDRMLVDPNVWREQDKPLFASMIRELKRGQPRLLIMYHSDGDLSEVVPDLIEIGVDILNPIQPECMDPVQVKRDYGDRLCLHGTLSIQRTLPFGSREDVRREVRERIETCGASGGLMLCPANHLQNDTPLENVLELYRAAGACE